MTSSTGETPRTDSAFFGSGFFDWQFGGAEHYRRLYAETGYDEERYWGGFSHDPVDPDAPLPAWAIGPFTKYEHNPVFRPAESGWDRGRFGGGVHNGSVLRKDGTYFYTYRGEQPIPDGYWADGQVGKLDFADIDYICDVGVATSADGVHFERDREHGPFFRHGDDAEFCFDDNCVVEHDGTYYMFCNRYNWRDHENPRDNGVFLSTSSDLRTWQKHGLVFPDASEIHRNACVLQTPDNRAVQLDRGFVMYLNNGLVAYSPDLVHWESRKVGRLWPGGEGCFAVTNYDDAHPDAIVLFTGGHHTGHFYAIGEVLLSQDDPERALDWLPRPVLVAEDRYPWEDCRSPDDPQQFVSCFRDTIFFTGMTRHENLWRMYYGGSEVYTCLATAEA